MYFAVLAASVVLFVIAGCQQNSSSGSGSNSNVSGAVANVGVSEANQSTILYDFPAEFDLDHATISGNVFYLDPTNGAIDGDGSEQSPWTSLQAVIEAGYVQGTDPYGRSFNNSAPVQPGDTLVLLSGYHGSVSINSYCNSDYINVLVPDSEVAVVGSLALKGSSKWRFDGLSVIGEYDDRYPDAFHMVRVTEESSFITIDNFSISTAEDLSSWTLSEWSSSASLGVKVLNSSYVVVRGNRVANVSGGIYVDADNIIVQGNTVQYFTADGLQGNGSDLYFVGNFVSDSVEVNDLQGDAFQSWSSGDDAACERVVLSGNIFVSVSDAASPFPGDFSGINCFDGPYNDWTIENNLIVTAATEGIVIYGASGALVVNNTVLSDSSEVLSYISLYDGKDDTLSSDCVIQNNITNGVNAVESVSIDSNLVLPELSTYARHFVDVDNFNYSLLAGSTALDVGVDTYAPFYDILGVERPQGEKVDLGAYELKQ